MERSRALDSTRDEETDHGIFFISTAIVSDFADPVGAPGYRRSGLFVGHEPKGWRVDHTQSFTRYMGDLNNGLFTLGLSFPQVTLNPDDFVVFNYLIVNSGNRVSSAVVEQTIQSGCGKNSVYVVNWQALERGDAASVTVPRVTENPLMTAENLLRSSGLTWSLPVEIPPSPEVVGQEPVSGVIVSPGYQVKLTLETAK